MTRSTGGRYLDCIEAKRHRREKGENDVNLASNFLAFFWILNIGNKKRDENVKEKKILSQLIIYIIYII